MFESKTEGTRKYEKEKIYFQDLENVAQVEYEYLRLHY